MSQKYCTDVLNHRESAWTLKAKVPGGGSSYFSLNAVGNWSNEFLSVKNLRIFRVYEGNNCEFNDTNQDHDDIFLVKVPIDANVNHKPDDLRYHKDKPNH